MRVMRPLLLLKLDIHCLLLLQSDDKYALRFVCGFQENVEIYLINCVGECDCFIHQSLKVQHGSQLRRIVVGCDEDHADGPC